MSIISTFALHLHKTAHTSSSGAFFFPVAFIPHIVEFIPHIFGFIPHIVESARAVVKPLGQVLAYTVKQQVQSLICDSLSSSVH